MKILNDHKGEVDGTCVLSAWEADLICEGLVHLMTDIPDEHPDMPVASNLHSKMNALFNLLEARDFPYTPVEES
jgi:hypothetical protein